MGSCHLPGFSFVARTLPVPSLATIDHPGSLPAFDQMLGAKRGAFHGPPGTHEALSGVGVAKLVLALARDSPSRKLVQN